MIEEITVRLSDYIGLGMIAIAGILFSLLFFLVADKMRRLADRYRLKYGFDKDIENKEFNPDRFEYREKMFKKRVFKD